MLRQLDHAWPRRSCAALFLLGSVALVACTSTASATSPSPAPPTPVAPAALSTLPPPKPLAVPAADGQPAVAIENFNYVSADLTVPVGTTVVWTNHDDVEHTVTTSDGSFTSPSIPTDGQFSHTFSSAGTFTYFCAIHPFMTARVTVQ